MQEMQDIHKVQVVLEMQKVQKMEELQEVLVGEEVYAEKERVVEEVEKYFKDLLRGKVRNESDWSACRGQDKRMGDYFEGNGRDEEYLIGNFSVEEIRKGIDGLKSGKAVGSDDIPNEFLRNGGSAVDSAICRLFNAVLSSGRVPKVWNEGRITLIHKGGDKRVLDNYRVSSCLCNLYTRVLKARIDKRY